MPDSLPAPVTEFAAQFNAFLAENSARLQALSDALSESEHFDDLSEVLEDHADDLKSYLGSAAANSASDDEDDQDKAISLAEGWVTDNVSNSTLSTRIAAVLWLEGFDKGEALLREPLSA